MPQVPVDPHFGRLRPSPPIICKSSKGSTLTRVVAPPAPEMSNPIFGNFRPYIVEREMDFNLPDQLVGAAGPSNGSPDRSTFWVRTNTTFDQNCSPQVRPRENIEYHPHLPAPALPALLCLTEAVEGNALQDFWKQFEAFDASVENAIDQSFDDGVRAGALATVAGGMEAVSAGVALGPAALGLAACFGYAFVGVVAIQGTRYAIKQYRSFSHQKKHDDCAIEVVRIYQSIGENLSQSQFEQRWRATKVCLDNLMAIESETPEESARTTRQLGICGRALEELRQFAQSFYSRTVEAKGAQP